MSNKLIKDNSVKKQNKLVKHLMKESGTGLKRMPNWLYYLFLIVILLCIASEIPW